MSKLRLAYKLTKRVTLSGDPTSPLEVIVTRLVVLVRLANNPTPFDGVIDTGAPLSLVPKKLWDQPTIRDYVTWLHSPPRTPNATLPTLSLLGQTYSYRLGRVTVQAFDATAATLPPTAVTAQFLEDDPLPNHPSLKPEVVIGLTHGILDNRYLVMKPDVSGKSEAWLTDERPVALLKP